MHPRHAPLFQLFHGKSCLISHRNYGYKLRAQILCALAPNRWRESEEREKKRRKKAATKRMIPTNEANSAHLNSIENQRAIAKCAEGVTGRQRGKIKRI